jgi:hypothetical protein
MSQIFDNEMHCRIIDTILKQGCDERCQEAWKSSLHTVLKRFIIYLHFRLS